MGVLIDLIGVVDIGDNVAQVNLYSGRSGSAKDLSLSGVCFSININEIRCSFVTDFVITLLL